MFSFDNFLVSEESETIEDKPETSKVGDGKKKEKKKKKRKKGT